jgi:hypothetical protein
VFTFPGASSSLINFTNLSTSFTEGAAIQKPRTGSKLSNDCCAFNTAGKMNHSNKTGKHSFFIIVIILVIDQQNNQ